MTSTSPMRIKRKNTLNETNPPTIEFYIEDSSITLKLAETYMTCQFKYFTERKMTNFIKAIKHRISTVLKIDEHNEFSYDADYEILTICLVDEVMMVLEIDKIIGGKDHVCEQLEIFCDN